jgi:hypothetical protein
MEYPAYVFDSLEREQEYRHYIQADNFIKDSNNDERFKRKNPKTGKFYTGPSQIVIRPMYQNTLHEELVKNDYVQLNTGYLYKILPVTEKPWNPERPYASRVDETKYTGLPVLIETDALEEFNIVYKVVVKDGPVTPIDKSDVRMVWRGTVPWQSDIRRAPGWMIPSNPEFERHKGEDYLCVDPPFDEYVYSLNIPVVDNTRSLLSSNSVSLAEKYCIEIMDMYPQLEFVTDNIETQGNEGESMLHLYVSSSDTFNEPSKRTTNYAQLDTLFNQSPPLSKALTVYRKYEDPPDILYSLKEGGTIASDRYLSTSLSLSYLPTFSMGYASSPMYCRIDIMPGVKVLPLLNWELFLSVASSSMQPIGGEASEFEILLPRNIRLYKLPLLKQYAHGITIKNKVGTSGPELPELTHHFVAFTDVDEFNVLYPDAPWDAKRADDVRTFPVHVKMKDVDIISENDRIETLERNRKKVRKEGLGELGRSLDRSLIRRIEHERARDPGERGGRSRARNRGRGKRRTRRTISVRNLKIYEK